jgi:hypothetical protein
VSSIPAHGEVYSIQLNGIKCVSDFWQVGGCLRVLRFPPPNTITLSTPFIKCDTMD